jgi:hypothetical protein
MMNLFFYAASFQNSYLSFYALNKTPSVTLSSYYQGSYFWNILDIYGGMCVIHSEIRLNTL